MSLKSWLTRPRFRVSPRVLVLAVLRGIRAEYELRPYARLEARQHSGAPVEPGQHSFYTIAQNTERLDLDVAAGRTYVVLVRVNFSRVAFGA